MPVTSRVPQRELIPKRNLTEDKEVELDFEEWPRDSSKWMIQMLRSCVPTPQVQPLDQNVSCSWTVFASKLAAVWKRTSYTETLELCRRPYYPNHTRSHLIMEARLSLVSTWVEDDLGIARDEERKLTSVTLTTPICGADKSMSNVFSQYGTSCGENQIHQLNRG